MSEVAFARLVKMEGQRWCNEFFNDKYYCREDKDHGGDHSCPASRTEKS